MHAGAGEQQQAGGGQQAAQDEHGPRADRRHQPRGQDGAGDRGPAHRQEVQAGVERVVAAHVLQVQRREEEHGEEGAAVEREAEARRAQAARREQPQRHERLGDAALVGDEAGEQGDAGREGGEHLGRAPAERAGPDDAEHEREHAGRAEQRAHDVEPGVAASSRLSGTSRGVMAATTTAIGRLTKKIASQPSESTSTPPAMTPSVPPRPASAPQMPSAVLRSRPCGNVTVTMASAAGDSSAPPKPCSARAAIRTPDDGARPPASEPSANSPRPARKTRRRPSTSPRRPPSSRKPPNSSR